MSVHTRRANTMHGVCVTFAIVRCIKTRRVWFAATMIEFIIHKVFVTGVGNYSLIMTNNGEKCLNLSTLKMFL